MNTLFKALAGDGESRARRVEPRRRVAFETLLGVPGTQEHSRCREQEQRKPQTISLLAEHGILILIQKRLRSGGKCAALTHSG